MAEFEIENGILFEFSGKEEVLTLPEGLKKIANSAFFCYNKFKKVIFPASIVDVNGEAFNLCKNIEEIEVSKDHPWLYVEGDCLIDRRTKSIVLGTKKSKIPTDGSVTSIGAHAFGGTSNSGVFIPLCIERVGDEAFFANENYYIFVEAESEPPDWSDIWCPTGVTEDEIWWEAGDPDIIIYYGSKDK